MKQVNLKTSEEVELLRLNNQLVSATLAALAPRVKPGAKTGDLDRFAEEFICDHGAKPGFKGYCGYPYTLCISVNDVVVHGMPGDYELQEGDIVSIDCGTLMHGFYGDSAYTFAVGAISPEAQQLIDVTRESLEVGIRAALHGNRTGDVGNAVQQHVQTYGYGVVREMVGHGLGRSMHEEPEVPNYGKAGSGKLLSAGMVICIEPMITLGRHAIVQERDGWTIRTRDHSLAVHFEKAVAITKGEPDVLTTYKEIDEAVAASRS